MIILILLTILFILFLIYKTNINLFKQTNIIEHFDTINLSNITYGNNGFLTGLTIQSLDMNGNLPDGNYFIGLHDAKILLNYDHDIENIYTVDKYDPVRGILSTTNELPSMNKNMIFKIKSNQLFTLDELYTFVGRTKKWPTEPPFNAPMFSIGYDPKLYPPLKIYKDYTIRNKENTDSTTLFLGPTGMLSSPSKEFSKDGFSFGFFTFYKAPEYNVKPETPQQLINMGDINNNNQTVNDVTLYDLKNGITPYLYYIKFKNENKFLGIDYTNNLLIPIKSILDVSDNFFYINQNGIIYTYDFNKSNKYFFDGFHPNFYASINKLTGLSVQNFSTSLKINKNGNISFDIPKLDNLGKRILDDKNNEIISATIGLNQYGILDMCGNNLAQFELYKANLPTDYNVDTNMQIISPVVKYQLMAIQQISPEEPPEEDILPEENPVVRSLPARPVLPLNNASKDNNDNIPSSNLMLYLGIGIGVTILILIVIVIFVIFYIKRKNNDEINNNQNNIDALNDINNVNEIINENTNKNKKKKF